MLHRYIVVAARHARDRGRALFGTFLILGSLVVPLAVMAAASQGKDGIDIDTAPPYVLYGAAPNLILSLDDSRSMNLTFLPDDLWSVGTPFASTFAKLDARDTASLINPQYYNPAVNYLPPIDAVGTPIASANFKAAGMDAIYAAYACSSACTGSCDCSSYNCTLDLSKNYAPPWNLDATYQKLCSDLTGTGTPANQYSVDVNSDAFKTFKALKENVYLSDATLARAWAAHCMRSGEAGDCPAFYHRFDRDATYKSGSLPRKSCAALDLHAIVPATFPADCLARVEVGTDAELEAKIYDLDQKDITGDVLARRRAALDPAGALDPRDLAKLNFANWFSFYRTRFQAVQTVLSRTMNDLPKRVRLGYNDSLASGEYAVGDVAYTKLAKSFGPYTAGARQNFYSWLFQKRADLNTYLVSAALRAHTFFSQDQPYREYPMLNADGSGLAVPAHPTSNPARGCRNNVHLIFTDGFWEDRMVPGDPLKGTSFVPPAWLANNDNSARTLPDPGLHNQELGVPTAYVPGGSVSFVYRDSVGVEHTGNTKIYRDYLSGMLADVTFRSWIEDLRPGTADGAADPVPPIINNSTGTVASQFWNPNNDMADWQHVTTFTVGFGIAGNTKFPSGTWSYTAGSTTSSGTIYSDGFAPPSGTSPPNAACGWSAIGKTTTSRGATAYCSALLPQAVIIDDTWHAGINGRGGYLSARDPEGLTGALNQVLSSVAKLAADSSAAPVAVNVGSTASDDLVFQSRFTTVDWSGDVRSYQISDGLGKQPCPDVAVAGDLCQDPAKGEYYRSAAAVLADQLSHLVFQRRIFSIGTNGAAFSFASSSWSSLTDTQQADFLSGSTWLPGNTPSTAELAEAQARLDYVAGARTYEADGQTYDFRKRTTLLGDFINSGPVVVGSPAYYYNASGYLSATATGQPAFKDLVRTTMVYAGANDGMLHAFKASDLTESFAFVPPAVMGLRGDPRDAILRPGLLHFLSNPAYTHRSYVDGQLASGDVWLGAADSGSWRTVLIGGLGRGGPALFALDVTNPPADGAQVSSFADNLFLWEITDRRPDTEPSDLTGEHWDSNLGYVFARPAIARVRGAGGSTTPVWAVILGNGYNSAEPDGSRAPGCDDVTLDVKDPDSNALCGEAVLYVIDIGNGTFLHKFRTGVGRKDDPSPEAVDPARRRPNALGQATLVGTTLTDAAGNAVDGDPAADTAYAADLFGNLWRFDLTGTSTRPVRKLFSATSPEVEKDGAVVAASSAQPITAPVTVARHPSGRGRLVLFGTGKYLAVSDVSDRQIQSFYAIWDQDDDNQATVLRSELLQQEFDTTDILVRGSDGTEVSRARASTAHAIDWSTHLGWYIDLDIEKDTGTDLNKGERVVDVPLVLGSRVIFVSLVPENNPCEGGGYSWINVLDVRNGARFKATPFDINLDGTFNAADLVTNSGNESVGASSLRFTPGGKSTGVYSAVTSSGDAKGRTSLRVSCEGSVCGTGTDEYLQWRVWQQLP